MYTCQVVHYCLPPEIGNKILLKFTAEFFSLYETECINFQQTLMDPGEDYRLLSLWMNALGRHCEINKITVRFSSWPEVSNDVQHWIFEIVHVQCLSKYSSL